MNTRTMTPMQLRLAGLEVLARELGPIGMVRFLHQFETGQGNYSRERQQWLDDLDSEKIAKSILDRRKPSHPK